MFKSKPAPDYSAFLGLTDLLKSYCEKTSLYKSCVILVITQS